MADVERDSLRDIILDSIADGVFTVDKDWRITSFNRAAEAITGVTRQEAIGKPCCDVFRASVCESECALRRTLETGKETVNKAVYIVNADGNRIPISISTAILRDRRGRVIGGVETFRDLSLVEELRKELTGQYTFADILGKSREMRRLFEMLPQVAASDSTVLIEGESGTGKELFARAIHDLSARRKKPFVAVSCAALPDALLESELFGYKAGAFTDARKDKPGRFALAEGGTAFLDEIGDISAAMQVRLLRVLQERAFEPLGGTESVKANVRVVAATNRELAKLVEDGKFRSDLYYRINVVRLTLPPLRERRDDIPLLAEHFIGKFNRLKGKDVAGLSAEALAILVGHDYPGNVRELENVIEHAFVLCGAGMIEPKHLPEHLRPAVPTAGATVGVAETLADMERRLILDALQRNAWNRLAAAKELGIHKSTLFRKIQALGITLPATDGRTAKS
ncbi:MAG: PAS domain-containing protein [Planctomycetes bacterium]|nr:PAS domain-containing protein [Planctomycetota bacterium]MBM4078832.1 PAS domain-containing protein [Planctomycetota bacterium]